jgi:hypothetical protein
MLAKQTKRVVARHTVLAGDLAYRGAGLGESSEFFAREPLHSHSGSNTVRLVNVPGLFGSGYRFHPSRLPDRVSASGQAFRPESLHGFSGQRLEVGVCNPSGIRLRSTVRTSWSANLTKRVIDRRVRHTDLACDLVYRRAGLRELNKLFVRKLPHSDCSIHSGSDSVRSFNVAGRFGRGDRFRPFRSPNQLRASPYTVGTDGLDDFSSQCLEVGVRHALCVESRSTFSAHRHVSLENDFTQPFMSKPLRPNSSATTPASLAERLHGLCGLGFPCFGRYCSPSSLAEVATLLVRHLELAAALPVVTARLQTIEPQDPFILDAVGFVLPENNSDDLVPETVRAKAANRNSEQCLSPVLSTLVSPPRSHGPFRSAFDRIAQRVHGLTDVLLSVVRTFSAPARVIVARVNVDREPALLSVRQSRVLSHRSSPLPRWTRCSGACGAASSTSFLVREAA